VCEKTYLNVRDGLTDRQTNGQTDDLLCGITALCRA